MAQVNAAEAEIDLDADLFMRQMLRELTGMLQDIVGMEEAEGYINSVGTAMGTWIERKYREEMGPVNLDPAQVAALFVDLKDRIGGGFYVISTDEDRIVLGNRRCPFGDKAAGRDSLCMMTSNVFGRIAADHLGYARVALEETIARGDGHCRVVVDLKRGDAQDADAKEYYRVEDAGGVG